MSDCVLVVCVLRRRTMPSDIISPRGPLGSLWVASTSAGYATRCATTKHAPGAALVCISRVNTPSMSHVLEGAGCEIPAGGKGRPEGRASSSFTFRAEGGLSI